LDTRFRLIISMLPGLALLGGVVSAAGTQAGPDAPTPSYRVIELAGGLAHPWSIVFLPDGDALISERNGGLRRLHQGVLDPQPVGGLPAAYAEVDGGLLGLAVHPQFADNRLVYVCLSMGNDRANASNVFRGRLEQSRLADPQRIFTARPQKAGASHFGCRLLFAPDGTLLITLGDGYDYRAQAQTLDNHFGKIVRVNDDGSIPADNPFVGQAGALPDIYTLGHRNVQGIAQRPGTREIWTHEHGPQGGDEVNVLCAGANYGWPTITYGIDYDGTVISERTAAPGMEQPLVYWVPSIAPSGMDFYHGDRFPAWRGDLFVGALAGKHLRRLDIEDGRIVAQETLPAELGERIRDVSSGPDGFLYVLTDSPQGRLLRLEPRTDR